VTERATARHRADVRPSTPLTGLSTTISTAVGDHAAVLGRGGVALAVSTGLITAVGLPAEASTRTGGDAARTASVPLLPEVASSPVLAAGAAALAAAPVTAPAQAKVTFEHSAFKALPQHGAAVTTPAGASRDIATISRSLARRAYVASQPAVVNRQQAAGTTRGSGAASDPAPSPAPAPGGHSSSVVAIAMRYLGVPYVYGGSTPRGFDCSGFTGYVYAQVGVKLARSADGQYRSVTRIARSQAVAGDLVFYLGGGGAYHVGIYLGGNSMIAAPHTGLRVRVQPIYSSNIAFARP
jgi:cell wall-associated NlpC family hydrolase